VVPAIERFARLGELRRDIALQAVDLASKCAGFGLHRIETRLEAFEGRGLFCACALGVHRLDPGFEGADFVGHLEHHAEDLGALAARLLPLECCGLRRPRGIGQLTPRKIGARTPVKPTRLAAKAACGPKRRRRSKRKGHRRPESWPAVSKDAEPRIESAACALILRIGASGEETSLASATASSEDMGRLQEWFPHKPCAHSLNSPLTKAGLKLQARLDPSQRYDGASDLSYAEPLCDNLPITVASLRYRPSRERMP
jgi:hypothetical protein